MALSGFENLMKQVGKASTRVSQKTSKLKDLREGFVRGVADYLSLALKITRLKIKIGGERSASLSGEGWYSRDFVTSQFQKSPTLVFSYVDLEGMISQIAEQLPPIIEKLKEVEGDVDTEIAKIERLMRCLSAASETE